MCVRASLAKLSREFTPKQEIAMRNFWKERGLKSVNQINNLVSLGHSRQVFRSPEAIDSKLQEFQKLVPVLDMSTIVAMTGRYPLLLSRTMAPSTPNPLPPNTPAKTGDNREEIGRTMDMGEKVLGLSELLPGVDIPKILRVFPQLLGLRLNTIRQRRDTLRRILQPHRLNAVLAQRPQLLAMDPNTTLRPNMKKLKMLLPTADIQRLVSKCPSVLCADIDNVITRNLRLLREMLPEATTRAIASHPQLLIMNSDNLAKRLDKLQQLFGHQSMDQTRAIVSIHLYLLCRNDDTLIQKMKKLCEVTGDPDATLKLACRFPYFLSSNPATLSCRIKLLSKMLKGSLLSNDDDIKPYLLTRPQVFMVSDGVYCRLEFVVQNLIDRWSWHTVLKTGISMFLKHFPDYLKFLQDSTAEQLAQNVGKICEMGQREFILKKLSVDICDPDSITKTDKWKNAQFLEQFLGVTNYLYIKYDISDAPSRH